MKPIQRVIVSCTPRDLWMTRICVASVRYWYPDVSIGLLKDVALGDFDTTELEETWEVERLVPGRVFSRFFTKMGAFFLPEKERFFLIDSDTVFAGPLLDHLSAFTEDFIVEWPFSKLLTAEERANYSSCDYLDVRTVKQHFPEYDPPPFFFNTGQMVITPGLFQWEDFAPLFDQGSPPEPLYPDMFHSFDQGILNFVMAEKIKRGAFTVQPLHFMKWPPNPASTNVDMGKIRRREGYPLLFHWAGLKQYYKTGMRYNDLLDFYERYYYSRISGGAVRKAWRLWQRHQRVKELYPFLLDDKGRNPVFFPKLLWQELWPRRESHLKAGPS